jgi:hypothetical protein
MKNTRTDGVLFALALIVAMVVIALMETLPEQLLQVNAVYQGF